MLKGKKIILGISGSIAAYKAAYLVRLLVGEGAEVRVIMTPMAAEFITPLTLATLSNNTVLIDFHDPESGDWNNHVEMGLWADLFLVAPATANTMAKMTAGLADNLLITTYLSARCPVWIAPAMDLDMFRHPTTQNNLDALAKTGNHILEPATGELASGLSGKGRMEEPENILKAVVSYFNEKKKLSSKRILITAGPTHEPIDNVRFISNYSSGKMGIALAEAAAGMGAKVDLVLGPTSEKVSEHLINVVNVKTAAEMYEETTRLFSSCDCAILSAAVGDFTPETKQDRKIKREKGDLTLTLKSTRDIAATLGQQKKEQLLVGFALESENEFENAKQKLSRKNLDFIVLNSLQDKGAGFHHDTNKITIIYRDNKTEEFELKPKREVAVDILDRISKYIKGKVS